MMKLTVLSSLAIHGILLFLWAEAAPTPHPVPASVCNATTDPNPEYPSGVFLNCSGLGLKQVPVDIPSNTTTLMLSFNELTDVPNDVFGQLGELRELDLSSNIISTLQPRAFRGLDQLIMLSLWNNSLILSAQIYPPDLFIPLVSLRSLRLNHNFYDRKKTALGMATEEADTPSANGLEDQHLAFQPEEAQTNVNYYHSGTMFQQAGILNMKASPQTALVTSLMVDDANKNERKVEVGYPDEALSRLSSLNHLAIDGLSNITFGPGFTKLTNLTHLDLNGKRGYCNLVTFDNATLANVPTVTQLNMSDCNITNLTKDAFRSLPLLENLDLSFNQVLGFDMLGEAFHGLLYTKLESLYIDAVVPMRSLGVVITSNQLRFFGQLRYLEKLWARFNRIEALNIGALCSGMPPNLKYANVDGNLFELAPYVNDVGCLKSLESLDMNGFDAFWTPPLRPPDVESYRSKSNHQRLYATQQNIDDEDRTKVSDRGSLALEGHESSTPGCLRGRQFSIPPKLQTLRASNFGLVYKLYKVRVNASNSLKKIDLSKNHFPVWFGHLCGFHSVTELYLMNTLTEYINNSFFSGFPALQVLNISSNMLRDVIRKDHDGKLFRGLKNLRVLDLSMNDIGHILNKTLLPLENLEELHMTVNGMGSFTPILSHMKKLRYLDLSKNQLHSIPKEIRHHLDWLAESNNVTVTVNMTFNPIACTCPNMDFLLWIRDSKVKFGTTYDYYCQRPDESLRYMDDLHGTITELERTCGSYVGVFVGAVASCLVVVTVLLVALAYRFRWKLRYLYYASRLGLKRSERLERQQQFHFDAFVSFSSEDNEFVDGEMKRRLEIEHGLRLCIHTRDFTPGQYIASSIVDSVQRSRRTLVILTRALLDSDWCHYELQMALMEGAYTGRDVLLFLLYEHVPAHELSRDMLANLQATVYIEFPHGEQDKDLFWARLAQALKE